MTQVVALKPGFHGGQYRKIGDIFELSEAKVAEAARRLAEAEKAGLKNKKPSFEVVNGDPRAARARAEKIVQAEADKRKAGAIAASGGVAAKQKVDAARDLAG